MRNTWPSYTYRRLQVEICSYFISIFYFYLKVGNVLYGSSGSRGRISWTAQKKFRPGFAGLKPPKKLFFRGFETSWKAGHPSPSPRATTDQRFLGRVIVLIDYIFLFLRKSDRAVQAVEYAHGCSTTGHGPKPAGKCFYTYPLTLPARRHCLSFFFWPEAPLIVVVVMKFRNHGVQFFWLSYLLFFSRSFHDGVSYIERFNRKGIYGVEESEKNTSTICVWLIQSNDDMQMTQCLRCK